MVRVPPWQRPDAHLYRMDGQIPMGASKCSSEVFFVVYYCFFRWFLKFLRRRRRQTRHKIFLSLCAYPLFSLSFAFPCLSSCSALHLFELYAPVWNIVFVKMVVVPPRRMNLPQASFGIEGTTPIKFAKSSWKDANASISAIVRVVDTRTKMLVVPAVKRGRPPQEAVRAPVRATVTPNLVVVTPNRVAVGALPLLHPHPNPPPILIVVPRSIPSPLVFVPQTRNTRPKFLLWLLTVEVKTLSIRMRREMT